MGPMRKRVPTLAGEAAIGVGARAQLHGGGLVAIGAVEGVAEEDGEGDAESVTAEKLARLAVMVVAKGGEYRGHAQRTADVTHHQGAADTDEQGGPGHAEAEQCMAPVDLDDGIQEYARGNGQQEELEAEKQRGDAESAQQRVGSEQVHGRAESGGRRAEAGVSEDGSRSFGGRRTEDGGRRRADFSPAA